MGIFDRCLLACDVDDTLVDNGYISPRNIEKIKWFVAEGGYFSISTGRTHGALKSVTEKIEDLSLGVVANGAMIFDFKAGKPLIDHHVDKRDKSIVEAVMALPLDIGVEIHSGIQVLAVRRNVETDLHQSYERLENRDMPLSEALTFPWTKVLFALRSKEDKNLLFDYISGFRTYSDFMDTSAVIEGKRHEYCEMLPKGISKYTGLKQLCEILDIKPGGLFAIGDYYNDLEMLKGADISGVPCNSPEDIKNCADFIGGTCHDGAVADFIDYLADMANKGKF